MKNFIKNLSPKHWAVLLGIITLEILSLIPAVSHIGAIVPMLKTVICLFVIHSFLKEPLKEYGLHTTRIPVQILSGIILAAIITYLINGNHMYLSIPDMAKRFLNNFPSLVYIFIYILHTLLYAFSEEVVYRGALLTIFKKLFHSPFISVCVSAFLFCLAHYHSYNHDWVRLIIIFIIGFIFSYLRAKEPKEFSLFTLAIAHCLYNVGVDFISGMAVFLNF